MGPLVKSFWGNSLHLLGAVTDAALLAFTLRRLRASVPLLAPLNKPRDRFLRACLGVFGTGEVAPRLQVGRGSGCAWGDVWVWMCVWECVHAAGGAGPRGGVEGRGRQGRRGGRARSHQAP